MAKTLELNENQKKKIRAYLRKIQRDLDLMHWHILFNFDCDVEEEAAGITYPQADYLQALITFNTKVMAEQWKARGWDEVKNLCLHEMVHVLLSHLVWAAQQRWISFEDFKKEHEAMTSHITHLLSRFI